MHSIGLALLITTIIFMVGAFAAAYFRKWPHNDPREQLALIAHDRLGWTAQAILFPLAFLATAFIFGLIGFRLPALWPRRLGIGATILFTAGFLFWVPLSILRLQYWSKAAQLLRTYDAADPVDVNFGSWTFWPYTVCVLAAIGLMGAALAIGSVLPLLGWIIAGLAAAGLVVGLLFWHDWPPFMSYIILLVMSIGLLAQ